MGVNDPIFSAVCCLDKERNGVRPSVAASTDSGAEKLRDAGGHRSTEPADYAAPFEGRGPIPGTDIQRSGEWWNCGCKQRKYFISYFFIQYLVVEYAKLDGLKFVYIFK